MPTTRAGALWPVLLLLIGSPISATAMMGGEGPPPCESRACFVEAVSACKANASYMTRTAAGASAQYSIQGPTEDGKCKLGMIYMRHPNAEWTYKPLHFVLDPQGDVETELKRTVTDCLEGTADSDQQCSGPLLELSGDQPE